MNFPCASLVASKLQERCFRLAKLPGTLGRARPELRKDIRNLPYSGYVIFSRCVEDRLEIVNILEGHRDIDSFLGPGAKS
jgi:toxin ParE1/3/4